MKKRTLFYVAAASLLTIGVIFVMKPTDGLLEIDDESLDVIELSELPGVSKKAIEQETKLFSLTSPILFDHDTQLAFMNLKVECADGIISEHVSFTTDGEKFNHFVDELLFLDEHFKDSGIKDFGEGAKDGVKKLVEGLWEIVRHPIETAKGLGHAAKGLWDYLGEVDDFDKIRYDINEFADQYYYGRLYEVGLDNDVNFELIQLPQTKDLLAYKTNAQLGGTASFEILTVFFAWTKIPKIEKAGKLSKLSSAFPRVTRALQKAQKKSEKINSSRAAYLEKASKATSSLIDPAKLRTLKSGSRATNPRLNKLMKQLYDQDRAGVPPKTALDNALKDAGASKKLVEDYHDPAIMRESVLSNYNDLKKSGVFDDPANLENLRFGRSPFATKGPFEGERLDVDHVIPVKYAPELEHNFSNLKYTSQGENLKKGRKLTDDTFVLAEKLDRSLGWDSSAIKEIVNNP